MKTLRMYGASDDLVESSGIPGCDEFGAWDSRDGVVVNAGFRIHSEAGDLAIFAVYHGNWAFTVQPTDYTENRFPAWPIRREWGTDCPYSETLVIECPDDAYLEHIEGADDAE